MRIRVNELIRSNIAGAKVSRVIRATTRNAGARSSGLSVSFMDRLNSGLLAPFEPEEPDESSGAVRVEGTDFAPSGKSIEPVLSWVELVSAPPCTGPLAAGAVPIAVGTVELATG